MGLGAVHAQRLDTLRGAATFQSVRVPYTVLAKMNYVHPETTVHTYPVILFLHGAGERGSDNRTQLTVGLPSLVRTLEAIGCQQYFIFAPQCPVGRRWVETDWTLPSHKMPDSLSPPLAAAMWAFDSLAQDILVDRQQLLLTGLSMGGFGVWDLAQRDPSRWAGMLPICGGGDTARAGQLAQLPIWAFHGEKDKLVKPSRTTDMVTAIKARGGKAQQSVLLGAGHLCWDKVYQDKEAIRWLMLQRRHD